MTFSPYASFLYPSREHLLWELYLSEFNLFPFHTKRLPMPWGMRVKMDSFIRNNLCPWETWKVWRVKIPLGKFHQFHLLCRFFTNFVFPNCLFVFIRSIFWFLVFFQHQLHGCYSFYDFPSTTLLWFGKILLTYLILQIKHGRFFFTFPCTLKPPKS